MVYFERTDKKMKNEKKSTKGIDVYQVDGEYLIQLGDLYDEDSLKIFHLDNLTDVLILVNGFFTGDLNVNEL